LKNELLELTRKYQFETEMLVRSGKYDTRDDFTVVVQPFFRDTVPPASVCNILRFTSKYK